MDARKTITSALLFGTLSLAISATTVLAGDWDREGSLKDPVSEPKLELSANVALTSDYVFRGFSQSGEHAAIQGGFDATYGMLYAGTWASSIDFGASGGQDVADIELDVYAGITPSVGPFDLDLGIIGYLYPDANDSGAELDYLELKAGASVKPIENVTLGGTVYYSPEYTGKTGEVWTLESSIGVDLPKLGPLSPSFSALLGTTIGENNNANFTTAFNDDQYVYWNAGLAFAYDKFSLDLRYWDTDVSDAGGFCSGETFQCDSRFVATLSASF